MASILRASLGFVVVSVPRDQRRARQAESLTHIRHAKRASNTGLWPLAPGPCRRSRHAITLLEVLMSMFVLAVGLLSVASLLPVGTFQATRGS